MIRAALCVLAILVAACASPRPVARSLTTTPAPPASADLRVGIARVDITPPPGLATFGHALDSHVTNGYWTRLYCRIFVLQSSAGGKFALVPCDLAGISALLHHAVIDLVADDASLHDIPGTHVLIAATHTHAGPAHYFESPAYAGSASTRLPGFDPEMVKFLAGKIVEGIREAAKSMQPAAARWRHDVLWGVTRNRSLAAYHANPVPVSFGAPELPSDALPEERAIDPRLDVLELEKVDAGNKNVGPLGWLVFFAMHPTVLPASNRLLGADTHGVISRLLESHLRRTNQQPSDGTAVAPKPDESAQPDDPLVAVFNTNEGDMSPKWMAGNYDEVVTVARKVAEKAAAGHRLSTAKWRRQLTLDGHYLQRRLSSAPLLNERDHLCQDPELGNAAGHGGSDHRSSIDSVFPMSSDIDTSRCDCQKPKRGLLGGLQRLLLGQSIQRYPEDVAFAMLRIDDVWLTFMPAELTVHAGALVNDRVRRFAGRHAEARIVGLANGYIQYITTEAEYGMQHYEGGSTLYGPKSAEFFADQAEILARAMVGQRTPGNGVDEILKLEYSLGPERHRLPREEDATPISKMRAPREKGDLCLLQELPEPVLCFWWTDAAPAITLGQKAPWLQVIDENGNPVKVCSNAAALDANEDDGKRCDPAATIDDRGIAFLTTVRERRNDGYIWGTIFRPSGNEWTQLLKPVRIRARGAQQAPPIDSDAFSFSRRPLKCTYVQAANCQIID
jgi:neutral ceramidase